MEPSFRHKDTLNALNGDQPLSAKLTFLHEVVAERYSFISRIAVAIYDPKTDALKTFIHSSGTADPLQLYEARLSDSASLSEILERGRPRVVNNLDVFRGVDKEHANRIRGEGYGASYTLPMYHHGAFFGFIFFNSREQDVFRTELLHYLDIVGHLLSLTVISELGNLRTLLAAVKSATDIANVRDTETGSHLDRMAHYARLIARDLAPDHDLNDEFVEMLFMFAPLHDVGKIGIPDSILLKPAKLSADEFEIMKTHARKGREIIDTLLANFEVGGMRQVDMLRNIAEHHHEAVDGGGYPAGLSGGSIPLESRIIAVADVFDALTSERPYKRAWSNDEAFSTLRQMAGGALDSQCVEALIRNRKQVEAIQERFGEDTLG